MDDKLEDDRFRDEEPESYWKKHYQEAVDHYDKENKQDTINITPEDATKPENEYDVKTNLEIKARRDREYPELEVGDIVRKFNKEREISKGTHRRLRRRHAKGNGNFKIDGSKI